MPPIRRPLIVATLRRHRALDLRPRLTEAGALLIGFGRDLDGKGLSPQEAGVLLENDVTDAIAEAMQAYAWLPQMDEVRATVVVTLVALAGLASCRAVGAACGRGDYAAAGDAVELDLAAVVGPESGRLAAQLRAGRVQVG